MTSASAAEINSCTLEALRSIGVQEDLAQQILDYRPYDNLDEVLVLPDDAEQLPAAFRELCSVAPSRVAVEGCCLQCWENTKLYIPGGADNVKRAWFGDPNFPWADEHRKGVLCTEAVIKRMRANQPLVASCACLGCDPAPGVWKQFRVEVFEAGPAVAEEPMFPKVYEAARDVPSGPRWVAFVRHAQAGHNVDQALIDNPDNALTDAGVAQALKARDGPAGEAVRAAELVVTSPLTRAMQTAGLLLGPSPGVRVLVDALGTERHSARCDEGTQKSELLARTPLEGLEECRDWEGWDAVPERWWPEPGEDQWARAEAFRAAARDRPEERIVFVGHGAFWDTVLGRYLQNCEVVFCDRALV